MEPKTNYTLVGLVVLILLGGLIATGLWLSVGLDQKKYNTYLVYIRESVSGLTEDSPVKYNGVKAGFVKKIKLNRADPQLVEILLSIEEDILITTSVSAVLISQGITGTVFLGLSASSEDLTPLQKEPGQPYPIIPSKPSLFNQLDSMLKEVSVNVNDVSIQLKKIFDDENTAYLKQTLANFKSVTEVIAKNTNNINHSLENADFFLHNLAKVSKQFPQVLEELKNGVNAVSTAGQQMTTTMKAGKLTIDKISQQTIPPAIMLLQRFNIIATNLEKISAEMRQNPAVIIRGTTPPQPGPGE